MSNALSAGNVVSLQIVSINNVLSVTGKTRAQYNSRSNVTSVISAGTLVDIAGLSISCAAGAMYTIEGKVVWEKATSGGVAFGCSLPALAGTGSYVTMMCMSGAASQNNNAAAAPFGFAVFSAIAAGQTAIVSVSVATVNVLRFTTIEGMVATSAAGSFQLMAKGSVAADSLSVRGGYLKAYRVY